MATPLRVGFLVDSDQVNQYVYDLLKYVAQQDEFAAPVIISGYMPAPVKRSLLTKITSRFRGGAWKKFPAKTLFDLIHRFVRKVELRETLLFRPEYTASSDVSDVGDLERIHVDGVWSASKLMLNFSEADIAALRAANLDAIVRCGSGIIKGAILDDVTTFGVLSFHHGDNRNNRGGPSGFWEVLQGEASSGFIIQRLNNELDGGDVLFRGNMMTAGSWTQNNANLQAKSNVFMMQLLASLAEKRELPPFEGMTLHDRALYKLDDNPWLLARYSMRVTLPLLWKKVANKVKPQSSIHWSVAFSRFDHFKKSLWRYQEVPNPPGRFLADPFVVTRGERTILYVEDYFYSDARGRISAIDISEGKQEFLGIVIDEPHHLSFPFPFEYEGQLYMLPEAFQSREMTLYRCDDFPLKWTPVTSLMSGVSAADTMLIPHGDYWYMFTNICSADIDDHQSELHIFYADSPLSQQWAPIGTGNPVLFDPLRGRNAGFITYQGELYRMNQIHAMDHYGKGFGINKVLELSPQGYREERVDSVMPDFKPDIHSTHHFYSNGHFSVVDFCRTVPMTRVQRGG